MDKKEYAVAIANRLNGEVKEVTKNNGIIMTGIIVRKENQRVMPTVYIDTMYDNGLSVEEASVQVQMIIDNNQVEDELLLDWLTDFKKVKPKLRARLLNSKTLAEVYRPADDYGFDDLIIIPVIRLDDFSNKAQTATIKVTQDMVKTWGVPTNTVIDIAEENSKSDTSRKTIIEALLGLNPDGLSVPISPADEFPIYVVTNSDSCNGAYAIIPMLDELREIYPDGFAVIPSSVHEVLVTPLQIGTPDEKQFDQMIGEVNDSEVALTDQLGDHVYIFR